MTLPVAAPGHGGVMYFRVEDLDRCWMQRERGASHEGLKIRVDPDDELGLCADHIALLRNG